MKTKSSRLIFFGLTISLILLSGISVYLLSSLKKPQLYWFIPDGLRADPDLFKLFEWAEQGQLPNIKKMMDAGAYGYSIPVFPSHTPINYASLLTGVLPSRHGVVDGPIRLFGYPLQTVTQSGFSSTTKLVEPLWVTLDRLGISTTMLSVPGSTPPEVLSGKVVRGRWGGWGFDFPSVIFQSRAENTSKKVAGGGTHFFQSANTLTKFVLARTPENWKIKLPVSFSPMKEVNLEEWDSGLRAVIWDSQNDQQMIYDKINFYKNKEKFLVTLTEGEWSGWIPVELKPKGGHQPIFTTAKFKVIKLGREGFFRIRILYNSLNSTLVYPSVLYKKLQNSIGSMVDFPDNFPPQLIYYPQDKATFEQESEMSFDWHKKALGHFFSERSQDVMIHSIYTPNQMLTSRWWMPVLDPSSIKYKNVDAANRKQAWDETLQMYKRIDAILGEALKKMNTKESFIVLSSDHGAIPLNYEVRLNNFFFKKGWLKYYFDQKTESYQIDWKKTKVVYLMMNHIYINPEGLDGPYYPSSGADYLSLRDKVIEALDQLQNPQGEKPLQKVLPRERSSEVGLSSDRVGDLIVMNKAGFNWIEDITQDGEVFSDSLKGGYKQAVDPQQKGLWTPFLIMGPGIKRNYKIQKPISHLDQYPTLLKALGIEPVHPTEHQPLAEIFQ